MSVTYRNTPWGDVIIEDSWPQWQKDQWLRLLGIIPTGFKPTYRRAFGSIEISPGVVQTWDLNGDYFPTRETAQHMADKYGDGTVIEVPFGGSGGLFMASANEFHIKLVDGRTVNAGILAAFYDRNPEDRFPGLANKLIRTALGLL